MVGIRILPCLLEMWNHSIALNGMIICCGWIGDGPLSCPDLKVAYVLFEENLLDELFQVLSEDPTVDGPVSLTVMVGVTFFCSEKWGIVSDLEDLVNGEPQQSEIFHQFVSSEQIRWKDGECLSFEGRLLLTIKHKHFKVSVMSVSDTCRTSTLARHLPDTYQTFRYRVKF